MGDSPLLIFCRSQVDTGQRRMAIARQAPCSLSPHWSMSRSTINYTNDADQQISYAGLAIDHSIGVFFGTLFEEPPPSALGVCFCTGKLFFLLIIPIYLALSFYCILLPAMYLPIVSSPPPVSYPISFPRFLSLTITFF